MMTALWIFQPRLLHGMQFIPCKAFDRGDSSRGGNSRGGITARANRDSVNVDCTGSTLSNATTELCSGQPCFVTDDPEQRHIFVEVDFNDLVVYVQFLHSLIFWIDGIIFAQLEVEFEII